MWLLASLLATLATPGCAPIARYSGPAPAPGAMRAFADGALAASDSAPDGRIAPGTTDLERRLAGDLRPESNPEYVTFLIYGDNRPGFRMEANSPAYMPVKKMSLRNPGKLARGLLWIPGFVITSFLPSFDAPRDLVSAFSQRPQGGGEMRVLGALERQLPADAVISTGDIVRDGRRGRHWEDWVERVASLRAHAPLFVAPGNHERTYQPGAREAWDRAVGEAPAPRQLWFALDVTEARARFLFLDSNVLTDSRGNYDDAEEDSLSEAQLAWADSMLASSQRYKFVVLHHPLITAGHYLNDWGGDRDTKAAHRRERLFELCARHGVTAVLAGHEHLYQRAWIKTPRGGFWHITTAGGGAPLYSIDRGTRDRVLARALPAGFSLDHASLVARREYHFCRMQIPRASSSGGEFRFDVLAVARNGRVEVIDMIHLNRSPGH